MDLRGTGITLHLQIFSVRFALRLSQTESFAPMIVAQKHLAHPTPAWSPLCILKDLRSFVGNFSISATSPSFYEALESLDIVFSRSLRKRLKKEITEAFPGMTFRLRNFVVPHDVTVFFNIESTEVGTVNAGDKPIPSLRFENVIEPKTLTLI